MAEDELKFRITADDQATDKVDRSTASLRQLKDTTQEAGQAAAQAALHDLDHSEAMQNSASAAAAAHGAEQTREQKLREMSRVLVNLKLQEIEQERAVARGEMTSSEAERQARRREVTIDRLSRELNDQAEAERRAGDAIRNANAHTRASIGDTDRAAAATRKFQNVVGMLPGSLGAAATAGGAIALMYQQIMESARAANEEMERNAELVRQQAKERIDLAALQGFDTDDQRRIHELSNFTGRSSGEIASGLTIVTSQFANESDAYRSDIATESAGVALQTSMDYSEIVKAVGLLTKQTGDAKMAANLLIKGIEQAGEADPAQFVRALSQSLGVAEQVGDFSTGEAVGLAAGATALGQETSQAITGLRRIISVLKAPTTNEQKEIFQRLNFTAGDPRVAAQQISDAMTSGALSDEDLVRLFGVETLSTSTLFFDPRRLKNTFQAIEAVDGVSGYDGRLASDNRAGIDQSQAQRMALLVDQLMQTRNNIAATDIASAEVKVVREAIETELTKATIEGLMSPYAAQSKLEAFDFTIGQGGSAESAAKIATVWQPMLHNVGRRIAGKHYIPPVNLYQTALDALDADPDTDVDALSDRVRDSAPVDPRSAGASGGTVVNNDNRQTVHIGTQLNAPGTQSPYTASNGRRR